MSPASKTLYYFGFYLLITGITLTVVPNLFLSMVQIPPTTEVWIRVLGAVVFGIGLYYVFMASANNVLFLTLTIYVRFSVLVWFTVFVVVGWAPAQLIIFGLIDAAGGGWTYFALKNQNN